MKKVLKTNPPEHMPDNDVNDSVREYPLYPDSEDIYNKSMKEKNMDPEDITRVKISGRSDKARANIEKESNDDASGRDLDIPGSELDDEQENVGNEVKITPLAAARFMNEKIKGSLVKIIDHAGHLSNP